MKALAVQRSIPMECACVPLVLPNSFKPGHSLLGGEFLDSHLLEKLDLFINPSFSMLHSRQGIKFKRVSSWLTRVFGWGVWNNPVTYLLLDIQSQ